MTEGGMDVDDGSLATETPIQQRIEQKLRANLNVEYFVRSAKCKTKGSDRNWWDVGYTKLMSIMA